MGIAAGLILMALVLITCIDVIGRYILSAPLTGAFEMTEILVAALVFAALPLTSERSEHVEVDLLASFIGEGFGRLLTRFGGLFSAALLATFSWRLWIYAVQLLHDGAVTNALGLSMAPLGFFASLSCLLSAAIMLYRAFVPSLTDPVPGKETTP
ncbi:TRAP transporter small permease [Paracoccus tegillarcae]|uniref:TRAP transporter small permease n=1 Tax=Paracoccus tegillarcae TaxID=1529068 RepID=UPI0013009048|nr:TRAP transporter small permease [Paracoccus tegillarcae]